MCQEVPESLSMLYEYHEFVMTRGITIKKFNKLYRTFPHRIGKFRLFNKRTNKEYFIKKPSQDAHFSGIVTVDYYMFGYFFMKRGLPNTFRWKQIRLLMQQENIEELAIRIYPMYKH